MLYINPKETSFLIIENPLQDVMYYGKPITYTYRHWLNSKAYTLITKQGIFIREIRSRKGLQRPTGFAMVKFEGNKGLSKVKISKIKKTA